MWDGMLCSLVEVYLLSAYSAYPLTLKMEVVSST
jgi:hypothetical protein